MIAELLGKKDTIFANTLESTICEDSDRGAPFATTNGVVREEANGR